MYTFLPPFEVFISEISILEMSGKGLAYGNATTTDADDGCDLLTLLEAIVS